MKEQNKTPEKENPRKRTKQKGDKQSIKCTVQNTVHKYAQGD